MKTVFAWLAVLLIWLTLPLVVYAARSPDWQGDQGEGRFIALIIGVLVVLICCRLLLGPSYLRPKQSATQQPPGEA